MTALMRLKILLAAALAFVGVAWFSAVDPASAALPTRCEASAANPSNTFLAEECQRERDEQTRLAAEEQAQWDAALASPNPCAVYLPQQGQFCEIENWREIAENCRDLEGYENDPRLIAVCWKYQEIQKANQRPKELREMRRAAEVRRERERERREWAYKPTVTRGQAELQVLHFLAGGATGWDRRKVGEIDCGGGQRSRTSWVCRARWLNGNVCRRGRFRVRGAGHSDGVAYFSVAGRWLAGFGAVERGRLYCF